MVLLGKYWHSNRESIEVFSPYAMHGVFSYVIYSEMLSALLWKKKVTIRIKYLIL